MRPQANLSTIRLWGLSALLFLLPGSGQAAKSDLYDSCMKYRPKKKYCRCVADKVYETSGISNDTKARLEKKFTVNVNEALGKPAGAVVTQSESEPLLGVYVPCLNLMTPKK